MYASGKIKEHQTLVWDDLQEILFISTYSWNVVVQQASLRICNMDKEIFTLNFFDHFLFLPNFRLMLTRYKQIQVIIAFLLGNGSLVI